MESSNFRAVIDENKCFANGDCIKVCEAKAITEGLKQMPMVCGAAELLPGKAIVDTEICNGCGDCIAACSRQAIEMVLVAG